MDNVSDFTRTLIEGRMREWRFTILDGNLDELPKVYQIVAPDENTALKMMVVEIMGYDEDLFYESYDDNSELNDFDEDEAFSGNDRIHYADDYAGKLTDTIYPSISKINIFDGTITEIHRYLKGFTWNDYEG